MMTKILNYIRKKITWFFIGGVVLAAPVADMAVQTQVEVSNIVTTQQELCLQETGNYCQFSKKVNSDLFGNKIRKHDYEVVIDVWEGGAGELRNQKGYRITYIEPYVNIATSTK